MSTHTISITVDGTDITDQVDTWDIAMQGPPAYCFEGRINLKSDTRWTLCDPDTSPGTLRLVITIDGDAWSFLIEERGESISATDFAFWISGRSKQALLGEGYALPVSDDASTGPQCGPGFESSCDEAGCATAGGTWNPVTETCSFSGGTPPETHPWQIGDTTPQAIITYLLASDYCPTAVSVTWNVENYPIFQNTLSVGTAYPIAIIAQLAQAIGADLVPHADGSLTIETFVGGDLSGETSAASYTGTDDIITLSSTRQGPSGINAVTVIGGAGEDLPQGGAWIAAEALEAVPETVTLLHDVRVYFWHPTSTWGAMIDDYGDAGTTVSPRAGGEGTESITETVSLSWGRGNTSKPDTTGETAVYFAADKDKKFSAREVTYDVKYKDFGVSGSTAGESYRVDFYFSDLSAETTYDFTVPEATPPPVYAAQTFYIYNADTLAIVAGASISIDGVYKGVSDASGVFTTSDTYEVGTTHTLLVTATGFTDSDVDTIANDDFVAQAPA